MHRADVTVGMPLAVMLADLLMAFFLFTFLRLPSLAGCSRALAIQSFPGYRLTPSYGQL